MIRDAALNPIFLREMREAMRAEARTDPWRIKLLVLLTLVAALIYGCASAGLYHISAPVAAFYVLALAESIYITRPVDPTTLVARERQQNTFEPLLLTPLTPGRYLAGHLQFQLAAALRRAAVMLPLFGAVYVLGGFSLGQFLAYQALLMSYLLGINTTLMAVANAQPVLTEGAMAAMTSRKGGKRQGAAANLNPVTLLAYCLLPLVIFGGNMAVHGSLLQALTLAGTPDASPTWDLIKSFALVHPFLTLLLWGDVLVFGHPVPVWIVTALFWVAVAQASALTFAHQIMIRKFRPDAGYRLGRFVLFCVTLVLIAALAWRVPHFGSAACAAVSVFYLLLRFSNPMGVPLRDPERWQILPRGDLFVHRAGNLLPFLATLVLPAIAVQVLLVERAALPGLGRAVALLLAEAVLTAAALLLGGLLVRMRKLARDASAASPAGTDPRPDQSAMPSPTAPPPVREEREKTAASPSNPVAGAAFAFWLLPLVPLPFEPLLRPTPAGGLVTAAIHATDPLLLLNPLRFGYLLISRNAELLMESKPLDVTTPPAPGAARLGLPLSYYEASLAAGAVVVGVLLILYLFASRRLSRASRARAANA